MLFFFLYCWWDCSKFKPCLFLFFLCLFFFFQWYPVVARQSSLKYVACVTPLEGRLVIGWMQHAMWKISTVMHSGLMTAMGWWYHMQAVGIKMTTVRPHLVREGKLARKTRLHFSAVVMQAFVILIWVWQPMSPHLVL